ncbi:unnamed protein product [Rotaria magnacalcarata]|uniref:Uncharacterized protein n=1 Tax=Rotaria magnacalcarata TaxID=392030 RepID=A0A815DUU2_9BILA|nr:unnamed protein product [Rotaria magnacalcarata]CAF1593756.1 unnamed protein product [Rotaria magnacalcarata]CAF1970800.1 unnamed protein product [Rotaria magnacalcarata]CAF2042436.1 unnamed protein product [Rotaria magnacalcarata]CAF2155487.1 unnamed protein product [Rotaria magnacalcarata]
MAEDEAKYWASTSPIAKRETSNQFSTIKDISPDVLSPDGLYFKINNEINTEMEDHLSLSPRQVIETQVKQMLEKNGIRQKSDVFQLNENMESDESYHEKSMSFFDRLLHQLTRPSASELDSNDDQVFLEVNHNESINNGNQSNNNISIFGAIRSFIGELNEEKDYIIGTIDDQTLVNRRQSRKAKSIISLVIKKPNAL